MKKEVKNKDVVINFIANMLTSAGGDIADFVSLFLTRDRLVIQFRGHTQIGYGEETRLIDEYQLGDVEYFEVEKQGEVEYIKFGVKNKNYEFHRDNSDHSDLATAFTQEINDIRLQYY